MDPAGGGIPLAGDTAPEENTPEVGQGIGAVATDQAIDTVERDRATDVMATLVLLRLHRESPVRSQSNNVSTSKRGYASVETSVRMPMITNLDLHHLRLRER